MPIMRSGYRALVNAVWGLVAGGIPVASRTVGQVNAGGPGNVAIHGDINGYLGGGMGGNVGGHVMGSVMGSVAMVNAGAPSNLAVNGYISGGMAIGSAATIKRRIKGSTIIVQPNVSQTTSLGVDVVEGLTLLRFHGSAVQSGAIAGDAAVSLFNPQNVQCHRGGSTGATQVYWELTEYYG